MNPKQFAGFKTKAFFPWVNSDSNIDLIDMHAHVLDIQNLEDAVKVMLSSNVSKRVIVTEWSQAQKASGWLDKNINPIVPMPKSTVIELPVARTNITTSATMSTSSGLVSITSPRSIQTLTTNRDYVEYAFKNPLEEDVWNVLVSTIGYDPAFMESAYHLFNSSNFHVVCYGAHRQYGDVMFDLKQLYSNMTVKGNTTYTKPNYLFLEWYMELSRNVSKGMEVKTI